MRMQIRKRRVHNGKIYVDPFPVEKLKRVDRPTTLIIEDKGGRTGKRLQQGRPRDLWAPVAKGRDCC